MIETTKAHQILTSIRKALDADDDGFDDRDGSYRLWMRDSLSSRVPFQLYADRSGVEDDDHPRFVGAEKIGNLAEKKAPNYTVRVWDSEKRYFCVEITPKA